MDIGAVISEAAEALKLLCTRRCLSTVGAAAVLLVCVGLLGR